MKKLLVLSGKGGTGKTTVASALIVLHNAQAFADCDVDAPNLHLVAPPMGEPAVSDFSGMDVAKIDPDRCVRCGLCEKTCRFDAIRDAVVSGFLCEGCGVCERLCPVGAITMKKHISGELRLYRKDKTVFSTATLRMGSGASGKLVAQVKKELFDRVADADLAIIDGSPGIGCPVIASISGVDMVLIVSEPTVAGIHDMKRILHTAMQLGAVCAVCVNKYDINLENTKQIERYCAENAVSFVGRIPFDETVSKAINQCKSIASYPESPACRAIADVWKKLRQDLKIAVHTYKS